MSGEHAVENTQESNVIRACMQCGKHSWVLAETTESYLTFPCSPGFKELFSMNSHAGWNGASPRRAVTSVALPSVLSMAYKGSHVAYLTIPERARGK